MCLAGPAFNTASRKDLRTSEGSTWCLPRSFVSGFSQRCSWGEYLLPGPIPGGIRVFPVQRAGQPDTAPPFRHVTFVNRLDCRELASTVLDSSRDMTTGRRVCFRERTTSPRSLTFRPSAVRYRNGSAASAWFCVEALTDSRTASLVRKALISGSAKSARRTGRLG